MKIIGHVSRLIAICAMLVALSNVSSRTLAQDTGDVSTAEETSSSVFASVDVGCWPEGDGSQSTCSFTGYSSDGAAVEALWVPGWVACAEVVGTSGTWNGDGYHTESNSLTLTLAGAVSAGGGAGYMVRVAGLAVEASGSGLVCSAPPVVEEEVPADTGTEGEDPGVSEEPTDEGTPPVEAEPGTGEETTEPTETTDDETVGDGEGETDGNTAGNATEGEDDGTTDPETEASPVPSDEGTGEETGPVGDGSAPTEVETPETAEADGEGEEVSTAAVEVDLTALVYNCSIDPGAVDPATVPECEAADGLDVTVTENGSGAETLQTSAGSVTFLVTLGAGVVVTAEVPDNYLPIGNGSHSFLVEGATTVTFVNVSEDDQGDPQLGRLQLVHGSCPSSEPKDPKFVVVPPTSLRASAEESCGPTPFAVLTITGGSLGNGGHTAVTDDHGIWQGFLPAGEYTVSVASGSQGGIPVVADELTAVVVIEYNVPANGTLTVTRTLCDAGDAEGTEIIVSDQEVDTGGAGCGPANGQFNLSDLSNSDSIEFSLGNDGTSTQTLPTGTYSLTDLASGQSANVAITEGGSTFAAVKTVSVYGTLVVRHYWCDDPDSSEQDPSDDSYWETNCREANGGVDLTLYDGEGNEVDTSTGSGGGVVTWQQVEPGTYSVETASGLCAAFIDGADASGGFTVNAGSTTFVKVYSCADPDDGGNNGGDDDDDDGGNNGGGDDDDADDDDGGNNNGNNNDDDDADNENEVATVNTLPNTGIAGTSSNSNGTEFGLIALGALATLLAGAAVARRRTS